MILKPIPEKDRPMLQLKIFAAEAFKGGRKEWGYKRRWEGNYLMNVSPYLLIIVFYRGYSFL